MELTPQEQSKNNGRLLLIVIFGLIVALLLLYMCNRNKGETIKVAVPEKTGKFDNAKPLNVPIIHDTIVKFKSLLIKANSPQLENDTINERLLSENAILLHDFKTYKDSVKNAKYSDAITLHDFSHTFEDSIIKIDMSGKARGTVESIGVPKYTIKASTQKVNVKTYQLLGGVELGANTKLDQFAAKANLIYQSPNGRQYSAGYDNRGVIYVGTAITIFKHTKTK